MTEKFAYLFVLDTFSDWEPGFLIAELNSGRFFREPGTRLPVRTVAVSRAPVVSLGGMRVQPDVTLDEISPADAALLVLPGAGTWAEERHAPAIEKAREFLSAGVPVGAICGGAEALAEVGMLDDRAHTANDLDALEMLAPSYRGRANYIDAAAVTDGNLITAGGMNALEFAKEVLARLDVFSPATLEAWYQLNKTAEARYFGELMAALPQPVG